MWRLGLLISTISLLACSMPQSGPGRCPQGQTSEKAALAVHPDARLLDAALAATHGLGGALHGVAGLLVATAREAELVARARDVTGAAVEAVGAHVATLRATACAAGQCEPQACGETVCPAGSVCRASACVDVSCVGVDYPTTGVLPERGGSGTCISGSAGRVVLIWSR